MFENRNEFSYRPSRNAIYSGVAAALLLPAVGLLAASPANEGSGGPAPVLAEVLGLLPTHLVARNDQAALPESPVAEDEGAAASSLAASVPNIHGETSVENFQGTQNNLTYTHESAGGFRDWLGKWYATNFHYKDTGVSTWLFHDYSGAGHNYDLWNSGGIDYGIDAVMIAFQSSHGGMSSPNHFVTSLGANWSGTGWSARSDLMALGGNYWTSGDERLRYMFWDTCDSVKVSGGNSPYSTWAPPARGIRFVFGYNTTSIDSPNYGKYFGQEWEKGKVLKTAFLDASWRISTSQSPAVLAFGATQSEAISRRDTERFFTSGAVSKSWGAWTWYNARSARMSAREALAVLTPVEPIPAAARGNSEAAVKQIAGVLGIGLANQSVVKTTASGLKLVRTDAVTLVVEKNGNYEVSLSVPEQETAGAAAALADDVLIQRAQDLAKQLGGAAAPSLAVGIIRETLENTGSKAKSQYQARATEKTVILDQTVDGTPFIDPEAGHLEITFNAKSGQVKRVRDTLVALGRAQPAAGRSSVVSIEEARETALADYRQQAGSASALAQTAKLQTESETVGYQVIDGKAVLVYRVQIASTALPFMRPVEVVVKLI